MFTSLIFSCWSIIRLVCNWILCIRIQKYIKSSCDSTVVAASCMHISSWSHLLFLTQLSSMFFAFTSVFEHLLCFHVLTAHFIHLWSSMVVCVTESRHHWWWSWGIWDKQGSHHLHFLAWERYEIWNLQDDFFEILNKKESSERYR